MRVLQSSCVVVGECWVSAGRAGNATDVHLNALGMSGEASTRPLIPTLHCSYYYNDLLKEYH